MRKIILVVCVAALLVSVASAATASTSYWIVKFLPGYWNGTNLSNSGLVSVGAGTSVSMPAAAAPANNAANIAAVSDGNFLGTDRRLAADGLPMTYELALAVGSQYGQTGGSTVWVSLYSADRYLGVTNRSLPDEYFVTVESLDKSVNYGTWTGAELRMALDPPTGQRGPVGFEYAYHGTADAWASVTDADKFLVTVNIPEPGSLVALGSGLVGLVGFAIRRRRA